MPKIKFSDATVRKLKPADKTTWYSHDGDKFPGLRLAVGKTAKSWYLTKRNPATGRVQSVQLGRYPNMSVDIASERAAELGSEIHNGSRGDVQMVTLADAFERHCKVKREAGKLSPETERSYRSTIKNLDDFLGMKLERVSNAALQDCLSNLSPATGRLCKAIVSAAYKQARRQRPTLLNPAELIELRQIQKRKPLTSTGGDLSAILDAIEQVPSVQRRAAWTVMLFTGIRSTNVRTLRWDQVDLIEKTIHLPKMKNGEARTLPISDVVVEAFETVEGLDTILCFPSDKKAGVPIYHLDRLEGIARQHDTRHHFSTACGKIELPSYIIAYLRGDKMSADSHQMVAHYMGAVGSHAHVNRVAEVIKGGIAATSAS